MVSCGPGLGKGWLSGKCGTNSGLTKFLYSLLFSIEYPPVLAYPYAIADLALASAVFEISPITSPAVFSVRTALFKIKLIEMKIEMINIILNKAVLTEKTAGDVIGEISNTVDAKARSAIAYGYANTGGYSIENNKEYRNFVKPEFVPHLPDNQPLPRPGPKETIDEIPTSTDYYDGSKKLNTIKIHCKMYTSPRECLHNSSCGWCGSNGSCIAGTNLGPLEPCVKSSYIFSAPSPNWSPNNRVVNENVGGMSLTVVNK